MITIILFPFASWPETENLPCFSQHTSTESFISSLSFAAYPLLHPAGDAITAMWCHFTCQSNMMQLLHAGSYSDAESHWGFLWSWGWLEEAPRLSCCPVCVYMCVCAHHVCVHMCVSSEMQKEEDAALIPADSVADRTNAHTHAHTEN